MDKNTALVKMAFELRLECVFLGCKLGRLNSSMVRQMAEGV